ncbi:hypothetical protein NQ315_014252 [Exocentrus adspersus]|uniref:HTH psq-type domain-containing protein n=1 Tax=Exocentrus adspersus TaxID=1586481 RepID=A0AAV8V9K9_9CUCU|nr:hypothetical protein NQ315_014252 [Exocentrus adspersus]
MEFIDGEHIVGDTKRGSQKRPVNVTSRERKKQVRYSNHDPDLQQFAIVCNHNKSTLKCGQIGRDDVINLGNRYRQTGDGTQLIRHQKIAKQSIHNQKTTILNLSKKIGSLSIGKGEGNMGRFYRRRLRATIRRDYLSQRMEDALRAVIEDRMSFRQAANEFNVPKSSLYRKYRGLHNQSLGRPPALKVSQEKKITDALIYAAHCGIPFTKNDLRLFVKQFLDRSGIINPTFSNNMPGQNWINHFLLRHKENLTIRLSENIKRRRTEITAERVNEYFDNL